MLNYPSEMARVYYAFTNQSLTAIPTGRTAAYWAERCYRYQVGLPDVVVGGKNASFWLELWYYARTGQSYRNATGTQADWFWLAKLYDQFLRGANHNPNGQVGYASAAFWANKLLSTPNLNVSYLLRLLFTQDAAAPLATPYTEGVGSVTLVQVDGQLSKSDGKLQIPAQSTPVDGDLGFYGAGLTRAAGLAVFGKINLSTLGALAAGFRSAGSTATANILGLRQLNTGLTASAPAGTTGVLYPFSSGADYEFAVILRSSGGSLWLKSGAIWLQLYFFSTGNTTPVYPNLTGFSSVGAMDYYAVRRLAVPFTSDNGTVTQELLGARSAGDTFTHEADCLIGYTVTALQSGGTAIFSFRAQNSQNKWEVQHSSAGTITLIERVGNTPATRGTAASVLSNGHRVLIIAEGETIRVFSGAEGSEALRITYASAANFKTLTSGILTSFGTGGGVSNVRAEPRSLAAAPNTANAAAALAELNRSIP